MCTHYSRYGHSILKFIILQSSLFSCYQIRWTSPLSPIRQPVLDVVRRGKTQVTVLMTLSDFPKNSETSINGVINFKISITQIIIGRFIKKRCTSQVRAGHSALWARKSFSLLTTTALTLRSVISNDTVTLRVCYQNVIFHLKNYSSKSLKWGENFLTDTHTRSLPSYVLFVLRAKLLGLLQRFLWVHTTHATAHALSIIIWLIQIHLSDCLMFWLFIHSLWLLETFNCLFSNKMIDLHTFST